MLDDALRLVSTKTLLRGVPAVKVTGSTTIQVMLHEAAAECDELQQGRETVARASGVSAELLDHAAQHGPADPLSLDLRQPCRVELT